MSLLFYSSKVKKWKHTPFLCFTTGILYWCVDSSHKGWSIWLRNIRYGWVDILNHTCKIWICCYYNKSDVFVLIRCYCKIAICSSKEQRRTFTFLHIVIYFLRRNTVGGCKNITWCQDIKQNNMINPPFAKMSSVHSDSQEIVNNSFIRNSRHKAKAHFMLLNNLLLANKSPRRLLDISKAFKHGQMTKPSNTFIMSSAVLSTSFSRFKMSSSFAEIFISSFSRSSISLSVLQYRQNTDILQ